MFFFFFFSSPSLLSFLVRKSTWRASCSLELSFPAEVSSPHRCSQRETSLWAVTQPENTQNGHALSLGLRFRKESGPLGMMADSRTWAGSKLDESGTFCAASPQKKRRKKKSSVKQMTVIGGVSGEEPTEGLQSPKLSKYEAWHTSELNLIVCAWSNNLGNKIK